MEIVCIFFSSVALLVLVVGLIFLWKKDVKLEWNLKVVLFIEGIAVIMRAVYNYLYTAFVHEEASNEM